jgi:hypothetical protein
MSYFDDNFDYIVYGRYREEDDPYRDPTHSVACNRCGKTGLKWRTNDNGNWQLYEEIRGDRNQKLPHQCNPTTIDDFDAL